MNLLFVQHNALSSNSGIHVTNLASGLAQLGVEVVIAVPEDADRGSPAAATPFRVVGWGPEAESVRFTNGMGPDLVHAWTPRQHVAAATRSIAKTHGCPYVVHLEDNEHSLTASALGIGMAELLDRAKSDVPVQVPVTLAEPQDMRRLLEGAAGVTALVEPLLEFCPAHVPGVAISPAAEDALFFPRTADEGLKASLGLSPETRLVVYHGNSHFANVTEVRSLYVAIAALAQRGRNIRLVRLGTDYSEVVPPELPELAQCVVTVPFQPRERLPHYLALADLFVQPGRIDPFNAYRFPSKLPEFFAMGRPVILPATNVGTRIQDGVEGLLLHRGDALEIAKAIERVLDHPDLALRLATGARGFYERELNWGKSAESLLAFYQRIAASDEGDFPSDRGLRSTATRLERAASPPLIGYASVRDYSDSVDRIPALARINHDLKDAQRPWVYKAILATVPRGGRLLEIGGGDPWVADMLTRVGYQVTIVDPYDGTGGGPEHYDAIKARFPRVEFVRGYFPAVLDEGRHEPFDCIYSISVLEHLPPETIGSVFNGIARYSRSAASPTIHAIDHVLLGNGDAAHLAALEQMIGALGLGNDSLHEVLARLERDPDTYFLSAESHNLWRGAIPYDEFPMRRCVSVQVCAPAGGAVAAGR